MNYVEIIVIGVDDVNEGELLDNNLLHEELGRASSEMLVLRIEKLESFKYVK